VVYFAKTKQAIGRRLPALATFLPGDLAIKVNLNLQILFEKIARFNLQIK